jgi:hypothetical protein
MAQTKLCTSCGCTGLAKTHTPGHFLIELLLWFFFFVPGLIYSIWRLSARKRNCCPHCGHHGMIGLHTPQALMLRQQQAQAQAWYQHQQQQYAQYQQQQPALHY